MLEEESWFLSFSPVVIILDRFIVRIWFIDSAQS